jgi:hypothetical protein
MTVHLLLLQLQQVVQLVSPLTLTLLLPLVFRLRP